ncbi:MAG TPA: zinc-ribbon domain-containing protein [Blastocatellia bacterium]|nr:zinc-ribbon domain-containing protein [Blastocatellia bacterium]
MQCPKCGAENRDESNFCRYCATPLVARLDPPSGYIPSVPPPPPQTAPYGAQYPPPAYQQAPQPPAPLPVVGRLSCPRCGSPRVLKGGIATWAIVATIVGFLFVLCFSLFFLLVKDPNKCLNCGMEFK